ncbi:MAG: hypothetical protein K8T20_08355 [Planctomycetes bacterium]|nr:hypothetical protein [Planctomycetota bacterium]
MIPELSKTADPLADRWREAVEEQLNRGDIPNAIVAGLQQQGLSFAEAQRIVDAVVGRRVAPPPRPFLNPSTVRRLSSVWLAVAVIWSVTWCIVTVCRHGFSAGCREIGSEAGFILFSILMTTLPALLMSRKDPPGTSPV